jgi:hypothetical protein
LCGEKTIMAAPVRAAPILPDIAPNTLGPMTMPGTMTEVTATNWQLPKNLATEVLIR